MGVKPADRLASQTASACPPEPRITIWPGFFTVGAFIKTFEFRVSGDKKR
jgi:hypothetical protein